jgi:hypothetical protein
MNKFIEPTLIVFGIFLGIVVSISLCCVPFLILSKLVSEQTFLILSFGLIIHAIYTKK